MVHFLHPQLTYSKQTDKNIVTMDCTIVHNERLSGLAEDHKRHNIVVSNRIVNAKSATFNLRPKKLDMNTNLGEQS